MAKDLKNKHSLNMLGLIETKRQVVMRFDIARIWRNDGVGWEYVGSEGASGGLCAIVLVYGAHSRDEKSHMWEELSYVAGLCQVPCCFMGDFNEIVHVEEQKGTTSLPLSAEDFKNWIQDMHIVDLPLTDSRIDRALVSLKWLEKFPETQLRGGLRDLSDHCPLIVEEKILRGGPRLFRSLDSWFTHEGFIRIVKEKWRGLGEMQFTDKLKALTVPLGRWHKANFGDIDKKILKLEEEIKKIDDMMSRSRQAKDMDKNTRYFHNITSARRRNNKVDALVVNGRVVRNQARIKIAIREFYRDLYHQEVSPMVGLRDGLVEMITEEDAGTLMAMPSAEEIREAVWD
ncbi:uncharacterized protein [Arachis hypogaea]|uniref:uncharacterized protein n=1 Tax=Arachis hypogaea TaxID=3818 RepID=UPI000DEC541A|nr:uncharacterized protein LOC112748893 [Arachis hypogaea]